MRISALVAVSFSALFGFQACSSTQLGGGGSVVQGSAGETGNAQGKVVTASYLDAFNGLVSQLRAL